MQGGSTKLSRTLSSVERGLRAEFQEQLDRRDEEMTRQMEEWKRNLETRAFDFIQNRVRQMVAEQVETAVAEGRPTKKQKTEKRGDGSGRKCFVCGGLGTGRDVHRHRELGIELDGKCRKQVETFKTGGVITERRDEWCDKLRQNTSPLAQNMLAFLGGGRSMEVAGPSNALPVAPQQQASPEKKPKSSPLPVPVLNLEAVNRLCVSKPCPPELAGQECCVCQEKLLLRTPISTLPCNHVFHQHCIHTWLKESTMCPLCREDYAGPCGLGRLQTVLHTKAGFEVQVPPETVQAENGNSIDSTELRPTLSGLLGDVELQSLVDTAQDEGWLNSLNLDEWEMEPSVQQGLLNASFAAEVSPPALPDMCDGPGLAEGEEVKPEAGTAKE